MTQPGESTDRWNVRAMDSSRRSPKRGNFKLQVRVESSNSVTSNERLRDIEIDESPGAASAVTRCQARTIARSPLGRNQFARFPCRMNANEEPARRACAHARGLVVICDYSRWRLPVREKARPGYLPGEYRPDCTGCRETGCIVRTEHVFSGILLL